MRKGYGKAYGKRFGISGAGAAGAVCRSCHAPGRFSRGLFSAPVFCRKALCEGALRETALTGRRFISMDKAKALEFFAFTQIPVQL